MNTGNPALRAELQRLTEPPQGADLSWLDVQVREVEALNERIPHSVRLHTRFTQTSLSLSKLNCFMFAFGINPDRIRDVCNEQVFPGKEFISFLLKEGKLHGANGSDSIVVYLQDNIPEHAGIWMTGAVLSKWGGGATHIWQHALWDVPSSYGNKACLFEPVSVVEVYRCWADSKLHTTR